MKRQTAGLHWKFVLREGAQMMQRLYQEMETLQSLEFCCLCPEPVLDLQIGGFLIQDRFVHQG